MTAGAHHSSVFCRGMNGPGVGTLSEDGGPAGTTRRVSNWFLYIAISMYDAIPLSRR